MAASPNIRVTYINPHAGKVRHFASAAEAHAYYTEVDAAIKLVQDAGYLVSNDQGQPLANL